MKSLLIVRIYDSCELNHSIIQIEQAFIDSSQYVYGYKFSVKFHAILPAWIFSIEGDALVLSFKDLMQEAPYPKIIETLKERQALT